MFLKESLGDMLIADLDRNVIHVPVISQKLYDEYFFRAINTLRQRDVRNITVLFNTPGGSISAGFHFYDLLRSYPGEVTGIIESQCSSMGVVVFQACAKRIVRPCSRMGLHWGRRQVSLSEVEWIDPERVAHEVARARGDIDRYDQVVMRHFKGSKDDLWRLYRHEMTFVGREIVDAGLADELCEK